MTDASAPADSIRVRLAVSASAAYTPDLVDGVNAPAAYYGYVEAQTYDAALKTARAHRDFRDELLGRAEALLGYAGDEIAMYEIQVELDKEAAAFAASSYQPQPSDPAAAARALDPDGYGLLGIKPPLTSDSLKSAYRAAAKTHHPDVGGDNETMRLVNDAYALFSALLRQQALAQDAGVLLPPPAEPMTAVRLMAEVRMTVMRALVDDLAGDKAFDAYRSVELSDVEQDYGGAEILANLARLLAAAKRPKDAAAVLRDLGRVADDAAKRQLNYHPIFERASEACCDPQHIRFIPNHMRQANNLLRLGIIDRKRYDALAKRIGGADEKVAGDAAAFEKFVASRTFLTLPMDLEPATPAPSGLVPAPGYYSRVETMSDAERHEYMSAYHGGAAALALKYLPVRLDALLRAPFHGYDDIEAVLAEMRAFEAAPGVSQGMVALCECGIKVVAFLAGLPALDRPRRIELLNKVDADPGAPMQISVGIDPSTWSVSVSSSSPKPMFLNPQYAEFATSPLDRLERYANTGSTLTPQEQEQQRRENERRAKQWEQERAFRESEVYKNARDAASAKVPDPERFVRFVSALCEALYQRATDDEGPSEIPYWTDKLTINLVKVKRFDEALRWLDRYDSAPDSIRKSATPSVTEAIRKRGVRCEAAAKMTSAQGL